MFGPHHRASGATIRNFKSNTRLTKLAGQVIYCKFAFLVKLGIHIRSGCLGFGSTIPGNLFVVVDPVVRKRLAPPNGETILVAGASELGALAPQALSKSRGPRRAVTVFSFILVGTPFGGAVHGHHWMNRQLQYSNGQETENRLDSAEHAENLFVDLFVRVAMCWSFIVYDFVRKPFFLSACLVLAF